MQQILKDYGAILIFVLQLGWFLVAWWFKKSVATKEEVAALELRMKAVEDCVANAPDREDIARHALEMERMRGDMREFSAVIAGARETFAAKIDGAATLLKRTENQLTIITQHLLSGKD